ncbi:MAG: hypothetical protein KJN90_02355 [Gammaproteobacteria bacterium]|nr:hypothetical protein [Gammaproteobacteria bacterium]
MKSLDMNLSKNPMEIHRDYTRPIIVATTFTLFGELALLLYYGVYLIDEGSLLLKIVWTLGFCGLGMGMSLGAVIDLLLVNRVSVKTGIWMTALLSTLGLGLACNWLCLNLDKHFRFFGGAENVYLHFVPSFIGAAIGGWIVGWFLFSSNGRQLLDRIGI